MAKTRLELALMRSPRGHVEISENLHRAELTALERDKLVAEWVELTGDVSGQNDQKPQGGRPEGGISLAARQLPVDGKTDNAKRLNVSRSLKVASLSPEAQDAARESGLDDNRSALLEAALATSGAVIFTGT